jgi:conjugative transfer signal peptidase TraF
MRTAGLAALAPPGRPHSLGARTRGWRSPRRPQHAFRTLFLVGLASVLSTAASCVLAGHLLVNITPSMPRGLYWMRLGAAAVHREALVAFRVPPAVRDLVRQRNYLPDDAWLLKPVAAVAGDDVCIEHDELRIRGELQTHLRSVDQDGRPLPRDARCGNLPAGQVYVLAPDVRSFDSRVFGPLAIEHLHATVTPLWTF